MSDEKMRFGRFLLRAGFNVIVAAILFGLVNNIFGTTLASNENNAILTGAISLAAVWFVFQIFRIRRGPETWASLILGIFAGTTIVNLITNIMPNLSLPVLQIGGDFFSLAGTLAIATYFASDWIGLQIPFIRGR